MAALRRLLGASLVALLAACAISRSWLGPAQPIAPGLDLFRVADETLVEHAGPIAVSLLRLDPAKVRLASALSNDEVLDTEPVADIAARHHALAAVNGGFFNRTNGEPLGLLKVEGELVSDSTAIKGAVIIRGPADGPPPVVFDQLAAKMTMTFTADGRTWTVPIDGVDTTRERGRLMLYTPSYHADTDTAPTGTEWVLDGRPLTVVAVRPGVGRSPIPRTGAVLSFGGTTLPAALGVLANDVVVTLSTGWRSVNGLPASLLDAATDVVGGAGLLRRAGVAASDWKAEGLAADSFTSVRNPRTIVGADAHGQIWLAAVDGREPEYSIGMNFADLERLCDRLQMTDALNLDGGGSTTMVARGVVVNRPSDPAGPRPVGDALIVTSR